MKFPIILLLCLAASSAALTPPQAFRNVNLVRSINLEKGYVKETINVVIENIDKQAQDEYYLPVGPEVMAKLGGLEIRDKKDTSKPAFSFESVLDHEISRSVHRSSSSRCSSRTDCHSPQHYKIKLPEPLVPNAQQTLTISYHLLSSLFPLPKEINQQDPQYLLHKFSLYAPSAYLTSKQKLKIKFPTTDVPEYTGTPETQGSTFTYGPYEDIAAGAENEASVRYEYTKPLIHTTLLERDIEVSHWGGNLAFEERHWMINKAASLANHFSRVTWAASQFYNPPSPAIKELKVPLKVGSLNPYFTDEIGNVSTSHFRSNTREAVLELKPRYPVFGGWAFPFRIGWDANLNNFLGSTGSGQYVLKVPFLEGPKMSEGVSYDKVELRVILPEGAM